MLQHLDPLADLTPRERQIAIAYTSGQSHKEIAQTLGIAPSTVRTHVNTIYRKAGVSSKIELLHKLERSGDREASPTPKTRRAGWRPSVPQALLAGVSVAALAAIGIASLQGTEPVGRSLPSIAVLPLEAKSGTEDQLRFVDGLARDIVTDLAQFSDLAVISADSSFRPEFETLSPGLIGEALKVRYVLSGDIEWLASDVRVNMQVLETDSDRIVWAERFLAPASDLLTIRGDLATRVVGIVGPVEVANGRLRKTELERVKALPTDDLRAYDMFLKGMIHWEKFTPDDNLLAREAFLQATEIDPDYAKAYAMATWTYLTNVWNGRTESPQADLDEAIRLAERALSVDQTEPYSHWAMGAVQLFRRNHEQSIASYKRAVELNPNGADFLVFLGWALSYRNRTEEAHVYMERARALNPFHPGWYYWDIALAHFVDRNYQAAVDTLNQRNPKTTGTYELLAYSHAMLGNDAKARDALSRVLKVKPELTLARARQLEPFEHAGDLDHYIEAMRKAGVPEG